MDTMVLRTQQWLNETYNGRTGYVSVSETGNTGWNTIYALRRALQIELGITATSSNFGPSTTARFKERFPNGVHQQSVDDETEDNIYGIIQGALWCKGYSTNASYITTHFYSGTGNGIKSMKSDAGMINPDSTVTLNIMKALLSMDYFVCSSYNGGDEKIRAIQQYLNRNYEDYIGIGPCDGVYGRATNENVIYALQAEEGLSTSIANGNFGPSTKRYCPTIPYDNVATNAQGNKYTNENIKRFIKIIQIALYANGFGDGILSDTYNSQTVADFQREYALSMYNGICSLETWLSLLISCGDTSRSAQACDCATILTDEKAQTLYNNGYRRVGRYLSGTVASGASKALTKEELKIIFNNKLFPFLIHQGSANTPAYFTTANAKEDIDSAVQSAINLGIPTGETIYFAVDCDPVDTEITNYVIPYFKKISEEMSNTYNNKYVIGIYGTRNVCTRVSNKGYATYSFIGDMSTGYSGNMGFKLPSNWSFDQFTTVTIGSGDGRIEIDKDGMSGRDLGVISDLFLSDAGQVYNTLSDMFDLAMEYTQGNEARSNELVLQYIRKGKYGNSTLLGEDRGSDSSNFRWGVVDGIIDQDYCDLVDEKVFGKNFNFLDDVTGEYHDLAHWAAVLNAHLHTIIDENLVGFEALIDAYAGFGGDVISFSNEFEGHSERNLQWAKDNICESDVDTLFDLQDYIDDIDAVNIANIMYSSNLNLPEAFNSYYLSKTLNTDYLYKTRTTRFLQSCGGIAGLTLACNDLKANTFPTSVLKSMIGSSNETYINYAIEAFIYKVNEKMKEENQQ